MFVGSSVRGVGIAGAAKDAEVHIRGCGVEEGKDGSGMTDHLGGEVVVEIGGNIQRLHPIAGGERCLEEVTKHVGGGANHASGSTILMGSVGAREPYLNLMRKEERAGGVVQIATIVALERTNRTVELGGDPSNEMRQE
jgi:hypothetical protein